MPGPMATAFDHSRLSSTWAPAWSKVLALEHVVLEEKVAECIRLLDYDTLVFSLNRGLEHIISEVQ